MPRIDSSASLLYCPAALQEDKSLYEAARKIVYKDSGLMPKIVSDTTKISTLPLDAVFYYPIMTSNKHWWLHLVDAGDVKLVDKLIVSPECQLAVIRNVSEFESKKAGKKNLSVGEVNTASAFFKVVSQKITCIHDMIATSGGTVMVLFGGLNEAKLEAALRDTGNHYYGVIGSY
ncbi:MAG: hypothetical protein LBG89_00775 [Rickettsiales bacterium]|jgi:hypothetical protein|nr:hypothetical protein [Rickettsiales bacterium]